jgi:GNAT superfamily N-acetyltransferase
VAAFGYGYTGEHGQWWTDAVARSLTAEQRAEWLDPPHFEIVELHVRPSRQRSGVGSRLLAQLLTRQPHDRALLSTQTGSRKARSFYAKNGWTELADVDFGPGYPPYLVLGKLLRAEGGQRSGD